MLIRFSVKNYKSFDEEIELSMFPGKMRKHQNHIIRGTSANINVLKTAVIYGANASGKSNLIKAIKFAQDLIVKDTKPKQKIEVHNFRLNPESKSQSSSFEFEFRIGKKAYAYGFEVDQHRFIEEWLYEINRENEHPLFERKTNAEGRDFCFFQRA